MNDLTGIQRDLLYVIAGLDDPKGLRIKEELSEYYESEVNHSRLYTNLDTLVGEGLINKEEVDGRTNSYAITRRGRREIRSRETWEAGYVGDPSEEVSSN